MKAKLLRVKITNSSEDRIVEIIENIHSERIIFEEINDYYITIIMSTINRTENEIYHLLYDRGFNAFIDEL